MKKILVVLLVCGMTVTSLCSCDRKQSASAKKEMTITVWGPAEDQADENSFLQTACKQFAQEHADQWNLAFRYGVCPEGKAVQNVTQDPEAAADVYMFANDQLDTLIQANAIARLGGDALEQVLAENSQRVVDTVSDAQGNVYGVPFTINTWFMYYDSSKVTAQEALSLDAMMTKGTVAFPITDVWYLTAFYYANGGTMFGDGTDRNAGIAFGGEAGTEVTTYLANAIESGKLINDANGAGLDGLRNGEVVAIFSGTWDCKAVSDALGENYAAAPAPSVSIHGQMRQLLPFAGSKALGVNPHTKNPTVAVALAAYLGSAKMQQLHAQLRDGGVQPIANSIVNADQTMDVAALAQNTTFHNNSVLQPKLPEMTDYWTNAESMGKGLANREITAKNAQEATEKWNRILNGESGL